VADVNITLNLSGLPPTVSDLHIHLQYASEIATSIAALEETVSALDDKVASVVSGVATLLTNTTELVKDVQRLLSENNTTAAQEALDGVVTNLTTATENIASLDADVEAASPEPTTPEPTP